MGFADYANQIKPFVAIVGAENFHLVDGENLVQNPDYEWGKLLDFLEVEKDHFKFYKDEEKGFPCLDKPIKHCLNTAKGIFLNFYKTKMSQERREKQTFEKNTPILRISGTDFTSQQF